MVGQNAAIAAENYGYPGSAVVPYKANGPSVVTSNDPETNINAFKNWVDNKSTGQLVDIQEVKMDRTQGNSIMKP